MKKIVFSGLILSLLLTGCANNDNIKAPVIKGLSTISIKEVLVDNYYETSASVNAKNTIPIASMINGQVLSVNVKEGDYVRKGQLLLTIDARDVEQRRIAAIAGVKEASKSVEAAEQNLKLVNKTYSRYKNMYRENAMTAQEFDEISAKQRLAEIEYQKALQEVKKSKAGLGEINVYKGYSQVASPISGVIVEKNAEVGTIAMAGSPLLTIKSNSSLELIANIDESLINKLSTGMNVYLQPQNGKKIKSKISVIIPNIDPVTRTFKIKADVANLAAGEYVKIEIPIDKQKSLVVPSSSIVKKGELVGVYVVEDDNTISYRLIRTGKSFGGNIQVTSGLNDGDKIVVGGVERAVDGGKSK